MACIFDEGPAPHFDTSRAMLAEHRAMAREIKHLDGDMQQLVYENYSKFIAATDTIRAMKAQVDGLEGEMAQLRGIMGALRCVARARAGGDDDDDDDGRR